MHIRLRQGDLFAFAGLYAPGGDDHEPTCAIVTTSANALMAPIHARMPAILAPEDEATWLDPEETRTVAALACIESYPADQMEAYPVAPLVNNVRNDGPSLVEPQQLIADRSE